MRLTLITASSLLVLALGACNGFTGISATGDKPMGAASTAPGAATQMPQSANSLPQGAAVSAPVDSNIGKVGVTRY